MSLIEILDRNARKFPEKDAIRYEGRGLSFADLNDQAHRAAAVLQSWGVTKGDRVAIMNFNTPSFPIAFFGALAAGAAVVPVNHELAVPEVEYVLAHSGAKVFLFDGALVPLAGNLDTTARRVSLDTQADGCPHFDAALFPSEQVSKAGSISRTALPGANVKVMKCRLRNQLDNDPATD